jgi:hypothetical protein
MAGKSEQKDREEYAVKNQTLWDQHIAPERCRASHVEEAM